MNKLHLKQGITSFFVTLSGLFIFTSLSSIIFLKNTVFADNDNIIDQVSVTVPASCTFSNAVEDGDYAVTMTAGSYKDDIGNTDIQVFCNDTNGFSLYAIGYSGNQYGNTDLIIADPDIPNIATGTTTTGNTSSWAMKLTPVTTAISDITEPYSPTILSDTNGSYANFHVVPSTYTKVATFPSVTDRNIGSKLFTTYAVYIGRQQLAGTFTGKVKYTLVHPASEGAPTYPMPAEAGKIVYHPNGSNVVGVMGKQTARNSANVTLYPSNYSRQGYGFAGWSTTHDYSDPNGFYGPMQDITTPADTTTNGLSLYAYWIKSAGSLQNWTGCSSLASGAVTALTDERDNNTYAVAKLADGKCWMIENLRLDNTATGNSTGSLAQGYDSSFIGLANAESPWSDYENTTANSLYSTDGSTLKTISGSNQAYRFPRYHNGNTTSRQNDASSFSAESYTYSYGNYYTWAAAIADTNNYTGTDQSVSTTSICPTGWRLPTGGQAYASDSTSGVNVTGDPSTFRDFYNLLYLIMGSTAYEDNPTRGQYTSSTVNAGGYTAIKAIRRFPNNFIYSGQIQQSGKLMQRGYGGYYWTSTAHDASNANAMFYLSLSNGLGPGTSNAGKSEGKTIRCVTGS